MTTDTGPSVSFTSQPQIKSDRCEAYQFTYNGIIFKTMPIPCNNSYCCGTCDNRFCCDDESAKLTQSVCIDYERCETYTDANFSYVQAQVCVSRYCCGTCYNRYCCSELSLRLTHQDKCVPLTTSTKIPIIPTEPVTPQETDENYKVLIYSLRYLMITI